MYGDHMRDLQIRDESDEYTDYRGRKADPKKHGGIRAATFACVVEVLENTALFTSALGFVAYFLTTMHYPPAKSANMVTNFMATSFLLTIVGGFVSDSFFTRFTTFIFSCCIELLGLILLTYQAQHSHLQSAENKTPSLTLYTGLYAIATGVGGIKASLPAHGADQLDHSKQHLVSSFFSWYFFCVCTGALIAATVMVWVQQNHGWTLGFMISAIVLGFGLCIFAFGFPLYRYKRPAGSPLARIIKVFVSSAWNAKASPVASINRSAISQFDATQKSHDKFKFLNKALIDGTIDRAQVKETKSFLGLVPIFVTTILMNCCIAQLQTFSVQQGSIMNRKLHNFTIPPQSLAVFSLVFMVTSIPLFEQFKRIYGQKHSTKSKIFQPLARIGVGLAPASGSMAVAAVVEVKRREDSKNGITLSIFWLAWQYLLLGVSDTLAMGGMLEFFYSEAPDSMRSMCTALSWCSTAMGYYLSSVLVTISNSVSGRHGREWLGGHDLNQDRLELFYALLCILNFINLLLYVYCAKLY